MRWEALFADLTAQAEAAEADRWRADVGARERSERASVTLADRLAASAGAHLRVRLLDGSALTGQVRDGADAWLLLVDEARREHLVPTRGVTVIEGLDRASAPPGGTVRQLTLGHALRALARDRARVVVHTAGAEATGLLVSVGHDHLDVAERGATPMTVPFGAILWVSAA